MQGDWKQHCYNSGEGSYNQHSMAFLLHMATGNVTCLCVDVRGQYTHTYVWFLLLVSTFHCKIKLLWSSCDVVDFLVWVNVQLSITTKVTFQLHCLARTTWKISGVFSFHININCHVMIIVYMSIRIDFLSHRDRSSE